MIVLKARRNLAGFAYCSATYLVFVSVAEQIRLIAASLRDKFADYYFDEDEQARLWSVGCCFEASRDLVVAFDAAGLSAKAVRGYYLEVEDGYLDLVVPTFPEDFPEAFDGKWTHWWVEVGGFIVDITADQFHPSCPEDYRVVVEPIGCSRYGC